MTCHGVGIVCGKRTIFALNLVMQMLLVNMGFHRSLGAGWCHRAIILGATIAVDDLAGPLSERLRLPDDVSIHDLFLFRRHAPFA